MALKRNETYPGRFSNPTDDHPQGAFKNRSAPGAQDGSYLEQQWANDWDGFFGRLLTLAEVTPNGEVDTASSSQYYDALKSLFLQRANPFGDIKSDGTVQTALENLGLGEAAKRDVGTGTGQIPDRSAWSESYTTNGWRKSPDGYIEQWGISTHTTTDATITFPIPFPNGVVFLSEHDRTDGVQDSKSIWQFRGLTNTGFVALNLGTISRGNPSIQPALLSGCVWYAIGK